MLRRNRFSNEAMSEGGVATIFKDAYLNGAGALAGLAIILLAAVNPAGKSQGHAAAPPGNIRIEISWPQTINADVDLWVKGPKGDPVGYSNKGGEHYNLLRDDLGSQSDDDPVNYEVVYSRGLPSGGHCVNLHLYSNRSGVLPIAVKVLVAVAHGNAGEAKDANGPVLVSDVSLRKVGEETNVFCFIVDREGGIDTSKPENVYQSNAIKLRSSSKS